MANFDSADLLSRVKALLNRPSTDEAITDARPFRSHGRTVERPCLTCGAAIRTFASRIKDGKDKYCSRACYAKSLTKPRITLECVSCRQPFTIVPHHAKRQRKYCCQACHGIGRHGSRTDGGVIDGPGGYRWTYVPDAERATHTHALKQGRYIAEHVYKAERVLGRCLQKGEVVHHINADKADNRNENLLVCSASYHSELHGRMSRLYAQEKFGRSA